MIEVPLRHHVYSSLRGYKTLYCAQDLPSDTRLLLDEIARRCQRSATAGSVAAFLPLGHGFWGALRGFPHGVDHVGRPRVCIHTVVFDQAALAKVPFFTPTGVPSQLFTHDGVDLQYISHHLPSAWAVEDADPGTLAARLQGLREISLVRMLLPLLLVEGRSTYIIDGDPSVRIFDAVSTLLPPSRRRKLGYFRGSVSPEGGLPTSCGFFLLQQAPEDVETDPDVTMIDVNRRLSRNLPPMNRYAKSMLDWIERGNISALTKLLALADRTCATVEFNDYQLAQFADATQDSARLIANDGSIHPSVEPALAVRAASAYARAGCPHLSVFLLRESAKVIAPQDRALAKNIDELGRLPGDSAQALATVQKIVDQLDSAVNKGSQIDTKFML